MTPAAEPRVLPDVSVVIPTHDRPAFLGRAIASCAAQAQSALGLRVEVVVIDDGSAPPARIPETSEAAVHALRFETNRGRNAARNAGLDAASGRYVLFLDDDDALEPGALAAAVAEADAAVADLLVCRWQAADAEDGLVSIRHGSWTDRGYDSLLAGEAAPTSGVLYRRSHLDEIRWDERLSKLDDWDFFVRAAAPPARVVTSDVVAYTWTSHPGQGIRRASPLENAREFYVILDKLRAEIEARGELTAARRRRLAQYLYKELRFLARFDAAAFETRAAQILALDPRFAPRDEERSLLVRVLCRIVGLRPALRLYARARQWRGGRPPTGSAAPQET